MLRALEVYRLTGRPLSEHWANQAPAGVEQRLGQTASLISLEPEQRSWLHARIAQRFEAMLAAGFLDEVAALKARSDLHLELPAMRAVGYRQGWLHLAGVLDFSQFKADALTATRRLVKRQLTWLRQWPELNRIQIPASPDNVPDLPLNEVFAAVSGLRA